MKRFIQIITSERFLQLLVVAVLQSLVVFNVITGEQNVQLTNIISVLIGSSVAIRTYDRGSEVKAEALKTTTTVSMPFAVTEVTAKKTSKKK